MGRADPRGDTVRGPYAGFAEALLDERDLAEVAALALTTDRLDGRRVHLTGPRAHTHRELVTLIGQALGRPLVHVETPPDQAAAHLLRAGLPEPFVTALLARYARGGSDQVTDEVARALGRARTYRDWLTDHLHLFREQA